MKSRVRRVLKARSNLDTRARLMAAVASLSNRLPLSQIDAAKIAREAGVSWPTARRYLGDRAQVQELLRTQNPSIAREDSTRDRLVAAAARVFTERGYSGATLDEVSAAAGLTKGAVYWHFESKMQLFLALVQARDIRMKDWSLAALPRHSNDGDSVRVIEALIARQFSNLLADESHLRLYIEFLAAAREPEPRRELVRAYERQREIIETLVGELQRRGVIGASVPVSAIAQLLLVVFDGFVLMALVAPERARDPRTGPGLAEVLLRGIGAYLNP